MRSTAASIRRDQHQRAGQTPVVGSLPSPAWRRKQVAANVGEPGELQLEIGWDPENGGAGLPGRS